MLHQAKQVAQRTLQEQARQKGPREKGPTGLEPQAELMIQLGGHVSSAPI